MQSGKAPETFESTAPDIFAHILSYSKNAATLFYVNTTMRNKVREVMKKRQSANFLTLNAGEICYIVYGKASILAEKYVKQFENHDGKDIAMYEKGPPRILTENDMQNVRAAFYAPSSCSLAAMIPESEMKEKIIYLEKIENGIKYTRCYLEYGIKEPAKGEAYYTRVDIPKYIHGEITFQQLPLLECIANKPFAIGDYQPLYDRIIAILAARTHTNVYRMVPIFKDRTEAELYAANEAQLMSKDEQLPVVHECKLVNNLVISRKPEVLASTVTLNMARVHRPDITLTGLSYPCDMKGRVNVIMGHQKHNAM